MKYAKRTDGIYLTFTRAELAASPRLASIVKKGQIVKTASQSFSFSSTIELDDGRVIHVEVGGYYKPGSPGRRDLANGDPGYPSEGPECEIVSVMTDDGVNIYRQLDARQLKILNHQAYNHIG